MMALEEGNNLSGLSDGGFTLAGILAIILGRLAVAYDSEVGSGQKKAP